MDGDAIVARLRSAGVPREAFSTTLVKERCTELRAYVVDKEYESKSILYTSPQAAELPFYLVAKEMSLAGHDVFCCRLIDIHTALFKDTDESEAISASLERAKFIAIAGFYDVGGRVDQFMSAYESSYFISWFIRKHQNGIGFILHSGDVLAAAHQWWPSSFVAYINKRCKEYSSSTRLGK